MLAAVLLSLQRDKYGASSNRRFNAVPSLKYRCSSAAELFALTITPVCRGSVQRTKPQLVLKNLQRGFVLPIIEERVHTVSQKTVWHPGRTNPVNVKDIGDFLHS